MKIYVHIEDGRVSYVFSSEPIEIIVVDHDANPEDVEEDDTWNADDEVLIYTLTSHPLE